MKALLTIIGMFMLFIGYAQQTYNSGYRNATLPKQERQQQAQQFRNEMKKAETSPASQGKPATPVIVDMNTPQKVYVRPGVQPRVAVRSTNIADYTKLQVPPQRPNAKKGPRKIEQVDYSKPQEVTKRTN